MARLKDHIKSGPFLSHFIIDYGVFSELTTYSRLENFYQPAKGFSLD
jgi:hypothetical protein